MNDNVHGFQHYPKPVEVDALVQSIWERAGYVSCDAGIMPNNG